jgi:D-glycero-alpha-D-manno-heptose-7-phosphate kinase
VTLHSDFPTGAGLGGSSAALVALTGAIAAWKRERISRDALAMRSRTTEVEDLGIAGGWQDHYAAAFGGALALHLDANGNRAERITMDASLAHELARRCILVYTGQSRISARAIELVLQGYARRDPVVTTSLAAMKETAAQMAAVLTAGGTDAIDGLGRLLRTHWEHQRRLHAEISTPRIDLLSTRAYAAGALGVKALGASGGGCLAIIAPADGVESVRESLGGDAEILRWAVDEQGFTVVEEHDG